MQVTTAFFANIAVKKAGMQSKVDDHSPDLSTHKRSMCTVEIIVEHASTERNLHIKPGLFFLARDRFEEKKTLTIEIPFCRCTAKNDDSFSLTLARLSSFFVSSSCFF